MSHVGFPIEPPAFEQRLDFLRRALASPAGAAAEVVETHLSWVVLGETQVLKMKKPGGHPVIDLSSPEVRARNARDEVRLNRRLAPGVYLGVMRLRWRDGMLALAPDDPAGADPATIDWLVHMRRLPAARMLDRLAADGQVRPDEVERLAAVLAHFHRRARRVAIAGADYVRRIADEQRDHRRLFADARVDIPQAAACIDRFDEALAVHAGLLAHRAEAGRIIEGHGDLRPEHVCMLPRPVVIDCLEFDLALRELDPFDELAFLALELDMLGARWIGEALWRRCAEHLGDPPGDALRLVYTARRALLRARLVAAHVVDPRTRNPAAWRARACRYLDVARDATERALPLPAGGQAAGG